MHSSRVLSTPIRAKRCVPRRFDSARAAAVLRSIRSSFTVRSLLREFVTRGPQVTLAVDLLGPNVCFTHQQFIVKYPDERSRTDIPWHQDNGYGQLEPPLDLTVWIALDDCTTDNGCLWVLPGSEHGGLRAHTEVGGLRGVRVDEPGISVPMQRGDALLFGGALLHRSLPNRTDIAPRRTVSALLRSDRRDGQQRQSAGARRRIFVDGRRRSAVARPTRRIVRP